LDHSLEEIDAVPYQLTQQSLFFFLFSMRDHLLYQVFHLKFLEIHGNIIDA
jgi:hypothetical protein